MSKTACPSREELFGCLVGTLPEDEADVVLEHVSSCSRCQETLQTLNEVDDTLMARLRCAGQQDRYADEPERQEMLTRVRVMVGAAVGSGGGSPAGPAAPEFVPRTLGEYELLEKLGQGGMGAVYKARQTNLGRLVALKVVPKERSENQAAIARFYREMRAVGGLSHPNIVQAFDAREIDGSPVLAMEYVDGMDLAKLISATGALRVADACELVRQAAVGLQHAHEQGLVHRDIKPSNLILECGDSSLLSDQAAPPAAHSSSRGGAQSGDKASHSKACVKILDFGLAMLAANQPNRQEMTAAGTAMGTADYVSPEQVTDSHAVDIRSDIYSLGCTLYKLLSGRAPFVGPDFKNDVTKMMAHVDKVPPSISLLRTDLPPGLAAVVERMMAKKPEDRFATPGEVAAALGPFAVGADLGRLSNEAHGMLGLPTVETTRSASTGKLSASAHVDTATSAPLAPVLRGEGPGVRADARAAPQRPARRCPPRSIATLALAAAAAAIPLLFGVWVIIRDKGGKEVARMQVPEGGSATVADEQGKPVTDGKQPSEQPNAPTAGETSKRTVEKPALASTAGQRPKPVPIKLTPEPLNLPAGAPMSELALVARPAPLPGVRSWTIETRGHRGTIWSLAFSPDGTQLLAAGDDGTVRIWDPGDGHLLQALVGASAPVAWSPDGSLLGASATRNAHVIAGQTRPIPIPNYAINIWDAKTCRMLKTLPLEHPVHRMDWSPDGKLLAATVVRQAGPTLIMDAGTGPFLTMMFDVESERCLKVLPEQGGPRCQAAASIGSIRWSPDGSVLAEAFEDRVRRWDVRSQALLPDLPLEWASRCCWSPDGNWLLASGGKTPATRVWENATGKQVRELNEKAIDWLPDGKTIAAIGSQGELLLLDATTGSLRRRLDLPFPDNSGRYHFSRWGGGSRRGPFSPDAKLFAFSDFHSLSILDVQSGRISLRIQGHPALLRRTAWSPNEARLLVGSEEAIRIFDGRSGRQLHTLGSELPDLDFGSQAEWSPDGSSIAVGLQHLRLWKTDSNALVRELPSYPDLYTGRAWSPDGKRLAVVTNSKVQVFNTATGELFNTFSRTPADAVEARWSPNGKVVALRGVSTLIWDVDSGKELGQVRRSSNPTQSFAFSPDGAMLAVGFLNGEIKLCSAASAQVIDTLQKSQACVFALHWSSDAKRILSGSQDGTICEWDSHTGQVLRTVSGVGPGVFSPSGRHVGYPYGWADGSPGEFFVRVWKTETGQPQATIVLLRDDAYLTVSPSGHYRGSPGVERQLIYVVQTDAGQETLTPDEFSKRYNWKNDPEQVKLMDEPAADGRPSSP